MNYGHKQDPVIDKDNGFAAYISIFEDDKLPMEDHPFFKAQQKQFRYAITNYKVIHCTSCQGI